MIACSHADSDVDVSSENSSGLRIVLAPKDCDKFKISSLSELTHTELICFAISACSTVHLSNGFPQKSIKFFLISPFDPPLANIMHCNFFRTYLTTFLSFSRAGFSVSSNFFSPLPNMLGADLTAVTKSLSFFVSIDAD